MGCHKCGKDETVLVLLPNHRTLCQTCHMHLFPFNMELVFTRSHHYLYNRTLKMVETVMTVKEFMKCGWFQRKRVIQGNYVTYTLEYHGKVKCSRCVGYHWPMCMKEMCKLHRICTWKKDASAQWIHAS